MAPNAYSPKISKACAPCRTRKVKCNAAVVGLPCSSCVSRECIQECVLAPRKRRTLFPLTQQYTSETSIQTTESTYSNRSDESIHITHSESSIRHDSHISQDRHPPGRPQPDLLYLNILQDTVHDGAASHSDTGESNSASGDINSFDTQIRRWNPPLQLDDIDNEYLTKKKVFELPPAQYMDAMVKAYFDHVHPFAPVLNRNHFIQNYKSGDCCIFLLHALSTAASLYVPTEVILGCGYPDRSTAHTAFFSKAKLFHDFKCQGGSLPMLQGSMILGAIILDHPSDRDFQYWFHNSVRRASKLGIHNACLRNHESQKLYRRIWWILHNRDIFHFFVNTQNLRLLANAPQIIPLTEDDWESEDDQQDTKLLSPTTYRQKMSLIADSELAQIFATLVSLITNESPKDLRTLIQPLDTWRKSLPERMQTAHSLQENDIYLLEALTISYRFECIMFRLLYRGRWKARDTNVRDWARQRFRSAMLELDTIVKRVLVDNTILEMPTTFITTITALLALHIESALDASESSLMRSMARISIQHTMLALVQVEDNPAVKRAFPVFEMILSKNNIHLPASIDHDRTNQVPPVHGDHTLHDGHILPSEDTNLEPQDNHDEDLFTAEDFNGFEFFDRWQLEQLDFTGIY
ncbi:hypothetical protein KAF25_005921 [Fusarium avenaceum]|uniref:Zn(2)-C6 fungal-type domain-containing protein n=1 Tax=Fusarium avenaceum TaxID=40199 RepID=A0A9P7H2T3_9HYPO|nr:hypothetical protein KAF25_005921 [Fusarium avenaceum]